MTSSASTSALREVALGSAVSVLLFMSGFLVLFSPLPLLYVHLKRGRNACVMSSAISFVAVCMLYVFLLPWVSVHASTSVAMFLALPGTGLEKHLSEGIIQYFGGAYFVFFMAIAIALGEGAKKNWSVAKWIAVTVASGFVVIVLATALAQFMGGVSVFEGVRDYISSVIGEIVALNQSAGVSSPQVRYLEVNGPQVASILLTLVPSLLFVFVLLTSVLNMLVSRRFARAPHSIKRAREAISFRVADGWIWVVICCGLVFFLNNYILHSALLKIVAINGLVAMAAIYFFQGFAVVAFFLERVKMRFIKFAAYIAIIVFFQSVGLMLVGIGLADVWVDFRKRMRTKKIEREIRP